MHCKKKAQSLFIRIGKILLVLVGLFFLLFHIVLTTGYTFFIAGNDPFPSSEEDYPKFIFLSFLWGATFVLSVLAGAYLSSGVKRIFSLLILWFFTAILGPLVLHYSFIYSFLKMSALTVGVGLLGELCLSEMAFLPYRVVLVPIKFPKSSSLYFCQILSIVLLLLFSWLTCWGAFIKNDAMWLLYTEIDLPPLLFLLLLAGVFLVITISFSIQLTLSPFARHFVLFLCFSSFWFLIYHYRVLLYALLLGLVSFIYIYQIVKRKSLAPGTVINDERKYVDTFALCSLFFLSGILLVLPNLHIMITAITLPAALGFMYAFGSTGVLLVPRRLPLSPEG